MRFFIHRLPLLTLTLLLTAVPSAFAETKNFNAEQTKDIQAIVEKFLMEKPEVIMNAVEALRAKQMAEMQANSARAIADNMAALTAADAPSIGNPKADVTVVEFLDYNCGYCKRAFPDIQNVLKSDPNVRFVFKDIPVLGESSRLAAQWALAAHKQGKYFEYHAALMDHKGGKDEATLASLAQKTGLDVDRLRKDAASDAVKKMLDEDIALSAKIGVQGTPAFIVGKEFYPGYVGEDGLKRAIEKARSEAKGG